MGSTGQAKKSIKIQRHLVIAFWAKLPDRHLKFKCSVLHSNVDFYLNSTNIRNSNEFVTALAQTHPKGALMKLLIMTWDPVGIQVGHFFNFNTLGCVCFQMVVSETEANCLLNCHLTKGVRFTKCRYSGMQVLF